MVRRAGVGPELCPFKLLTATALAQKRAPPPPLGAKKHALATRAVKGRRQTPIAEYTHRGSGWLVAGENPFPALWRAEGGCSSRGFHGNGGRPPTSTRPHLTLRLGCSTTQQNPPPNQTQISTQVSASCPNEKAPNQSSISRRDPGSWNSALPPPWRERPSWRAPWRQRTAWERHSAISSTRCPSTTW